MKSLFAWQALPPPAYGSEPAWIHRAALIGALIALTGGLLQLALGLGEGWQAFLPLAVSALLFGLPHGAIDHLVALGLAGRQLKPGNLLLVTGIYALLALLYGGLWLIAPGAALLGFLIMTIYHWGKADTAFDSVRFPDGALPRSPFFRVVHTTLRGGLPIGLPLLVFPEPSVDFLRSCLQLFVDHGVPAVQLWRPWLGGALTLLLALELFLLWRHRSMSGSRYLLMETGLLLALFICLPPLAAIGWYFCLWHGLRHVLRLTRYGGGASTSQTCLNALGFFYYRALPFTLVSLLFLGLLGLGLPASETPMQWVALYLVLISTLTFPHIILVEWMDQNRRRRERA